MKQRSIEQRLTAESMKAWRLKRKLAAAGRETASLKAQNTVLRDNINMVSKAHIKATNALAAIDVDGKLFDRMTRP